MVCIPGPVRDRQPQTRKESSYLRTADTSAQSNYTPTGGDNVQKPTSLKVLSVTVLPNGAGPPNGCPPSANYGIMVDIKYQVLDQNSKAIALSSMTPHETGTHFDGSPLNGDIGPSAGYPTSSQTTASDGTFHDVPFECARCCHSVIRDLPRRRTSQSSCPADPHFLYEVRPPP